MADLLVRGLAVILLRALHQLGVTAAEAVVLRRVDAVSQINADGSYRRLIAYAEAGGVNHVIEISDIALMHAERQAAGVGVDVTGIFKQNPVNIGAVEREAQFQAVEEQCSPAKWESRQQVARTRLIFRKGPQSAAAATVETLRKRHGIRVVLCGRGAESRFEAQLRLARKDDLFAESVVRRISSKYANEICLGAQELGGETQIQGVV